MADRKWKSPSATPPSFYAILSVLLSFCLSFWARLVKFYEQQQREDLLNTSSKKKMGQVSAEIIMSVGQSAWVCVNEFKLKQVSVCEIRNLEIVCERKKSSGERQEEQSWKRRKVLSFWGEYEKSGECLFNLILLFCFYLFIGIQIRHIKVL